MKIIIHYESSWRNSFLDGDNNNPLPKRGREYLASMTTLKKDDNFIKRKVTLDTVMGLLNRLIGDQRKLYQARAKQYAQAYYFEQLEDKIRFVDHPVISQEIVYLRNMKGSMDQNSFTGMIRMTDPLFSADYAHLLWGVLLLSLEELLSFIIEAEASSKVWHASPLEVCEQMELLKAIKPFELEGLARVAVGVLERQFPGVEYLNQKKEVRPLGLYCSALYLQIERLSAKFDTATALTKSGAITGFSKRGFTPKDFMNRHTTGDKKRVWGNPYVLKQRIKGEGEVTSVLDKASGHLEIDLDVDRDKAQEVLRLIENAGVSSFYLGKKGLAYVSSIRV